MWIILDELRCILYSNLLDQCSTISQGPDLKVNAPSPSNTRFPPTAVPDRTPTLGLPIVAVRQGSASLFT